MEEQKKTLKIVVVGDGAVGKYIMNISNKERHRHRQGDRIMESLVTIALVQCSVSVSVSAQVCFKARRAIILFAGKTAMMLSYMVDKMPQDYQPTVSDTFTVDIKIGEEIVTLNIHDTAGQDEYER